MLAMQPVCYYSSNVNKHMGWQKTYKHIRWMLHEQMETDLEGVLLLLMQKCCNYQVLLTTI